MFETKTYVQTLVGLVALGCLTCYLPAQETPDSATADVLKAKGLRVVGGVAVVAEDALVAKMLKDVPGHRKQLIEAGKLLAAAEAAVLEREATLQQCVEQRRQLNAELANVDSALKHNKLVAAINSLTDRIRLLSDSQEVENHRRDARAKANELREKYVEQILNMRTTHDRVEQRYQDLAADASVVDALQALNESSAANESSKKKEVKLGPSRAFSAASKSLKTLEETVLSEEIALRKGDGGVFHVSVVVNGSKPVEFVLDTGAGILSVPESVARQIGLDVPSSAPIIQLQMADGRVIEARQVFAKNVRVGKFVVENVACAVLPPTAVAAEPLLGQTFLGQFSYKIDSDRGALVMTRVDGEKATDKARPAKKAKKK